ncbi:MAG: TldD/PmbA family protein [Acidimicrobiales bacterium]
MFDLGDLAQGIAARAEAGEELEAFVARSTSLSAKAYESEVESFTSSESFGVGIRVIRDGRMGFASAGTFDQEVLDDTLAEARDNARFTEPDEFVGLVEPDGVVPPELDLWRDDLAGTPTEAKVQMALDLEAAIRSADPRIIGVRTAAYGEASGEAAVASSRGLVVGSRGTSCSLGASALAREGDDTQIGGGSTIGRGVADLDPDEAVADAVLRATRLLGATQPPTTRVTVVLEPRLAATLLGIAGGTLTGDRVLKGRSPFADRVGETIASPLLTLVDDPTDRRSFGADRHDGEGLATRVNPLITDGVLQGFLHDGYTGRRSGTASTGSAVRGARSTPAPGCQALVMVAGDRSPEDLLADVQLGLFVQSFNGLHSGVNPVSGDFSVGADGLMIRAGAVAEPVRELTLASTLQRLLLGIVAVGDDLDWRSGGTAAATMVIGDVSMSGS